MTKDEIIRYDHLFGYYYETLLGALYARKMVSDDLTEKCRKDFYDRLAQEKELHLRRVYEYDALDNGEMVGAEIVADQDAPSMEDLAIAKELNDRLLSGKLGWFRL